MGEADAVMGVDLCNNTNKPLVYLSIAKRPDSEAT